MKGKQIFIIPGFTEYIGTLLSLFFKIYLFFQDFFFFFKAGFSFQMYFIVCGNMCFTDLSCESH